LDFHSQKKNKHADKKFFKIIHKRAEKEKIIEMESLKNTEERRGLREEEILINARF
jgi:hypothetical protein